MYATITLTMDVPVYPERVYRAWLDSYEHSLFTGQPARILSKVGDPFETMNGDCTGIIQIATPFDRIVQSWQMAAFPDNAPNSAIEIILEPTCTGSLVTLSHSGVAGNKTREVMNWWQEHYFSPLRGYFEALVGDYVADMGDG